MKAFLAVFRKEWTEARRRSVPVLQMPHILAAVPLRPVPGIIPSRRYLLRDQLESLAGPLSSSRRVATRWA